MFENCIDVSFFASWFLEGKRTYEKNSKQKIKSLLKLSKNADKANGQKKLNFLMCFFAVG